MPELPEVETVKRGVQPFLLNQTIKRIEVRQPKLRFPVADNMNCLCEGKQIIGISRRAKYLILQLSQGFLLLHLGMSGHLRPVQETTMPGKHDHIDLILTNGLALRYNDPRRFGFWIYIATNPAQHKLLAHLGPEPLSTDFNEEYLFNRAKNKTQSIKAFIMSNETVVGVGNIYATESLFLAGIHPKIATGSLSKSQFFHLCGHIKSTLAQAIQQGGTTLRDFYSFEGKPGYFATILKVYGRAGKPCATCNTLIQSITIAGRSSAFCPQCQPDEKSSVQAC
ncbi:MULTISPECIES: bifunctional DNA-formamidopyrimidine glycosylase/DNA-(apurinic or apyrimidinic site) lyase [Legionella]|uniref:Formamidopyrimidine-DNA glycosylase n=1 Tax=Legionella septentrionalis TaxID=2498109 RepID=A0A3S0VBI6_9GAMM|nr:MULTISPECIES: bifunctional DNA-formamidopyrimidine glycosylase/DNA-(apurinic or apyrimidinic site) lyase [Legionella]MCP0913945.1 bifunctional DNA-formamidopyrimidine glycosylase/DNA-(apurinic or apyrimidinic site) lyase [Legionella sp. 27cVA30]RUQ90393.1 bifunctional DNA-formamidopyrimidine glycosylase/DNA-(apurinic or apyrimidinic site) lyase [Legionella septentrionalis]RUR10740.1 bifunctional DNA-formamidopyrimidine glycosylase/DNA-(apurinic or apyrimidinic site) lyase [Legionella septentr